MLFHWGLFPRIKRNAGYILPGLCTNQSVAILQPKGELGGSGDLVIQDRLVANTQGSSSLKSADFPGTKVSALLP